MRRVKIAILTRNPEGANSQARQAKPQSRTPLRNQIKGLETSQLSSHRTLRDSAFQSHFVPDTRKYQTRRSSQANSRGCDLARSAIGARAENIYSSACPSFEKPVCSNKSR